MADFGIQAAVVLIAALWNRNDIRETRAELKDEAPSIRQEMKEGFQRIETRLLIIEDDMRAFHGKLGNLDGRLEANERLETRK